MNGRDGRAVGQRAVGDDQGQRSEVDDVGLDVRKQVVSCWACLVWPSRWASRWPLRCCRSAVRCGAAPSAWATGARARSGIDLGNDWLS